jgi:beta propeller repeat protein
MKQISRKLLVVLILLGALFTLGAGVRALSIRFIKFSDNLGYNGEFAADGDYVVWIGLEEGHEDMEELPEQDIYLYQVSTGVISNLTDNEDEQAGFNPRISGDYIAWNLYAEEGYEVYLHQISIGMTKVIAKGTVAYLNEEYLVYYGYSDDEYGVMLYELETGESKQVYAHSGYYRSAQIDGDYVVWVTGKNTKKADIGKDYELHLYQISTGIRKQLTHNSVYDGWPKIDGDYVVWFGEEAGNKDVYLYQISTSTTTKLTGDQMDDGPPKISGDYVVWASKGIDSNSSTNIYLYRISSGEMIEIAPILYYSGYFIQIDGDYLVWPGVDGVTLRQISSGTTVNLCSQNRDIGMFELSGNLIAGEAYFGFSDSGMFVIEIQEEISEPGDSGYDSEELIGWVDPYRNVPE